MNRRAVLLATCLLAMLLSGCWNRRELETLGIILAVGYDWDEERQEYVVSAQMAKPQAKQSDVGGGGQGPGAHVFTARGKTVFDASRNLSLIATRRAWWGHVQVLVIGEAAAKRGLDGLLDFVERDGETRPIYFVTVTKGWAGDLMHLQASLESVPALGLVSLVRAAGATSTSPVIRILDVSQAIEAPSSAILGVVGVSEGAGSDLGKPTKEFRLDGSAVFDKANLVGYLDDRETRGAMWVRGRVRGALLAVPCPGSPGKHIGVEVIHASAKVTPEVDRKGKVQVRAQIRVEANLGDQDCNFPYVKLDRIEELDRVVGNRIREEVVAAQKACAALNADCFGLTDRVMQRFPAYYEQVKVERRSWPMVLEIEVRVRATGAQLRSIRPK
jgi:spore germination protein KC